MFFGLDGLDVTSIFLAIAVIVFGVQDLIRERRTRLAEEKDQPD